MRKIVIFGNSGAGKSTLAKSLTKRESLAKSKPLPHLDLDTLAWLPLTEGTPPTRRALNDSKTDIEHFMAENENNGWVIEGCYSDLLQITLPSASEIIYLNLSVADCIANAKRRPWEPHKYESKQAQDANLSMLIEWIAQYTERSDTFSQASHQALFDSYQGKKTMHTSNHFDQ